MAEDGFKERLLEKLPDIFDLVLLFTGLAIFLLGAAHGITYKSYLPIDDEWWRIVVSVFGVIVMAVGLVIRLRVSGGTWAIPDKKKYEIKIIYPQSNSRVGQVDVHGTMKNELPKGYKLWVFRVYRDKRIYPLVECAIFKDNTWKAHDCKLGGAVGDGRGFSVNLVGPDGQALISFVKEAGQKFNPIRDEAVKCSGNQNLGFLPAVAEKTRDIIQCDIVYLDPV